MYRFKEANTMQITDNKQSFIETWHEIETKYSRSALAEEVRLSAVTARALAVGQPIGAEELATIWDLPLADTRMILDAARGRTIQLDDNDRLIGAAGLSLEKTDYELGIGEKKLHAWCAWDALFLPAYLGSTVSIRSKDPYTGRAISIEVAPTAVLDYEPVTTVLSVLIPDPEAQSALETGPGTKRCSSMRFFADRDSAARWTATNPRLTILTPAEALQVAQATWLNLLTPSTNNLQRRTS
jgi:Alkylmercury lyase